MRVFVAVDMEGTAGLVQWDNAQRELERRLMIEEVNAAARGAFAGGATEVFAGESHGNMRNLLPELLDPRVGFLSGQPKPMNHMAGVDSSFGLALFVGYHANAGTLPEVSFRFRSTASRWARSAPMPPCAGFTACRSVL